MPRTAKAKIKWSELYSFSCFRPNPAAGGPAPVEQRLGQPGFSRVVFCNEPQKHRIKPFKYSDNYVSTTKYNLLTFLPKALFEQFRRVANLYFLLAAVLSIASLAPVSKISLVAPLVIVVGISMIREAVEDWHRFLQDLDVNSRTMKVHVGNGLFVEKAWKSLSVGDVVKVSKNEYFASDLVLLSSSFEDGLCYVETMNLDGETNLKVKRCLEATLNLNEDAKFSDFRATINCEDPNPNLYTFVGSLTFKSQSYPLCSSQVLLRDSKLQNTNYAYGVVIFTGPDTKVIRNSTASPSKRSRIERRMDRIIYILFSMLLVISLISSIGSAVVTGSEKLKWWYVQLQEDNSFFNPSDLVFSGFLQFIRALILYGYLIPISLYVSIELVKVLQALLINRDVELHNEKTYKTVKARTSNLNEELGQVEMILSDKTGTLTCNQMEFRKCSIAGISYGGDVNEVDLAASKQMNIDIERYRFGLDGSDPTSQSFEMLEFSLADASTEKAIRDAEQGVDNFGKEKSRISTSGEGIVIKGFNFRDDRLMDKLWIGSSNVTDMIMFFRVMTLCHTGIPAEENEAGKFKYEAESPEEVAFLVAAQEFGFQFCGRTQSIMVVKELDPSSAIEVEREYKLLHLLEFCSSRKRMSVIVSNEDGRIFLLCKGADNIIFDRLAENGRTHQQATSLHLSSYAEDGLRTMAFAYRIIDTAEYEKWNKIFTEAKATMGPQREELIENASEMIEKDLILAGAVAVEDKLQKGVPECIDKLSQAGLKIWLLTGDKKETAINVGFACSLLRHDMRQIHLSTRKEAESRNSVEALENDILDQIEKCYRETRDKSNKDAPLALVIDGKALEIALRTDVKDEFLRLAVSCSSVICCRVSPKQKALITRLVKEFTGKTTLAIGDGANDIGMIQEADIGVGISGMEGMQAVMASDFSLPEFCFLERLLIVHGHWCYKRISKMILYFMYKNIVFGLTLFYYEVYTAFSGDVLYDDWFMVMFNVVLTSLPVIALGVLEQDVPADVCLQFPALYRQGQKNIYFSWERILGWILNGAVSSLAIFTINIYALSPAAFEDLGQVADLSHMGAIAYTCVIWTVNCQIALILSHFTWIQHLLIWGSILCWYIFLFFYGALPPGYSGTAFHILMEAIGPAPMYWAVTLLVERHNRKRNVVEGTEQLQEGNSCWVFC
ncbi:probable phospholipid-transporting ATPase 5 isoform X2 [Diospyros lotus]|uniref:probable phospholipid-transporting ATPase 5 isoform X2 n=1 Tax=Diospyros lotus TaxID=55363 RepID=UPI00224DB44D|nr:probable phospholipid-transporting ATPase 5 isoform X2 [Diospyros lotus]